MEKAAQGADGSGGGGSNHSNSSSRSSSRATSAGSSPACSLAGRGVASRAAGLGGGGSRSSPGSVAASPSGGGGRRREPALEGVLSKYTNLLQGWQNRYFVLDFEAGLLQYFVNEQSKHQKPRGVLSLCGAIVSLSDEAPHMLVVYSASGEMYKLRAADAKERQFWVTQLRACAKYHMETNTKMMNQVEGQQKNLVHAIESLPGSGPLTALDQDLLLLKATSAATLSCLGECLSLLQQSVHQVGQPGHKPGAPENILGWHGPKSHSTEQLRNGTLGSLPPASANITWAVLPNSAEDGQSPQPEPEPHSGPDLVLSEDEKSDNEDKEETELGVMEDQRSVILHLISQLKLGMDLTKVVLPTFILEKRSLLEMYADFMAHPDLLLAITAGATPEERVICFVEYYLTAFHEGRKGALAKKPYNPIIGETFHCSWEVPKDKVNPRRTATAPPSPADPHERPPADDPSQSYKLRFVAEQVSHHPPISCFYCECKEKRLCVNTHVWTKSKFMGMSVGVSMIGEGVLRLLEHGEDYVFTLPSAYARSILTIPWVELGGKVSINCAKTGYSATVIFHTKPFYGGKVHRVTAEVKHNPTNTIVCKAHGEWNGTLEFTYNNGETKVIDTTTLPVYPKKIRPLEKQGPMESRNLWREVTRYLRLGDIDAATEQKRRLEEKQRVEERKRENLRAPWRPKYFIQEGDGWVYLSPLWKAH
ncbi:oxysterol-binding protein-related protein 10 isoform X2 [Ochotona curzoniae]|uniref:oxysterol-binding protein-related protein 10 isoform X2 n=1 Tax=Ochotona curzoniae TaxID=130825 RepID=UPI001B34939D|nr:oxysterol-binding protein-related protein 10 isoform X2 [Ochotona curzoniae]